MNVSLLNLKAQYAGLKPEIEAKVLEVIASQQFVLGPEVEALEKRWPPSAERPAPSASPPARTPSSSP